MRALTLDGAHQTNEATTADNHPTRHSRTSPGYPTFSRSLTDHSATTKTTAKRKSNRSTTLLLAPLRLSCSIFFSFSFSFSFFHPRTLPLSISVVVRCPSASRMARSDEHHQIVCKHHKSGAGREIEKEIGGKSNRIIPMSTFFRPLDENGPWWWRVVANKNNNGHSNSPDSPRARACDRFFWFPRKKNMAKKSEGGEEKEEKKPHSV